MPSPSTTQEKSITFMEGATDVEKCRTMLKWNCTTMNWTCSCIESKNPSSWKTTHWNQSSRILLKNSPGAHSQWTSTRELWSSRRIVSIRRSGFGFRLDLFGIRGSMLIWPHTFTNPNQPFANASSSRPSNFSSTVPLSLKEKPLQNYMLFHGNSEKYLPSQPSKNLSPSQDLTSTLMKEKMST